MRILTRKRPLIMTLIFTGVLYSFIAVGQGNDQMPGSSSGPPKYYNPYILEVGTDLIYPISDYAYTDNFHGIFSVHGSALARLFSGLYGGLEGHYDQLSVSAGVPFPIATPTEHIFYYGLGLKLGYYSSMGGDWLFSFSVTGGETLVSYDNVPLQNPPGVGQQIFLCPRIFEGYKANDNLFIGLEITYTMYLYSFNPTSVGITTSYTQSQLSGFTSVLGWGFGLHYKLGKAKH